MSFDPNPLTAPIRAMGNPCMTDEEADAYEGSDEQLRAESRYNDCYANVDDEEGYIDESRV
jgi:hypothetical protein